MGGMISGGTDLSNGHRCKSDDQCQSGHCCPGSFLQPDRCRECCSDLHCSSLITEPPQPGTYGAPFCLDDSRTCSPYKDGRFSQIPESGYPIWVPIQDETDLAQVDIPRWVMEGEEPVMEQVWYFDLNEQPVDYVASQVEYNGTHVSLPLYTQMISGYSRTYKMYNENETGIITSIFTPNKVSVVTDKPMAGAAEKIHAITYESEYSTARGEHIRQRNEAIL